MKLKKGFTLIELVVVIALIAILAVTLAPRLRDQIAKAGDAKAIAVLGSMRTQSEIFFADNQAPVFNASATSGPSKTTSALALTELEDGLDNSAKKLFDEGTANFVPIGGVSSSPSGDVIYGGEITFTFGKDGDSTASTDGISLWLNATAKDGQGGTTATQDTKGKLWASY